MTFRWYVQRGRDITIGEEKVNKGKVNKNKAHTLRGCSATRFLDAADIVLELELELELEIECWIGGDWCVQHYLGTSRELRCGCSGVVVVNKERLAKKNCFFIYLLKRKTKIFSFCSRRFVFVCLFFCLFVCCAGHPYYHVYGHMAFCSPLELSLRIAAETWGGKWRSVTVSDGPLRTYRWQDYGTVLVIPILSPA